MQRAKSIKQNQTHMIKEVIAQFDIETQINKIAVRCFNDLLKSNKQAFQFITEYQQKLMDVEMRLAKTQAFAISIEMNVSSKLETANAVNRRLQTFSKEFYDSMKENEGLIGTMRKDYDSLITWTQKNTYQLRSSNDELKNNSKTLIKMEETLQQSISRMSNEMRQNMLQMQKQIIQNRTSTDKIATTLIESKAQFLAKGTGFEEISKDMELYKHERMILDRRLKDVLNELDTKANKADLSQMRLMFDSQMSTEHEQNMIKFQQVLANIKQEIYDRKKEIKRISQESSQKWQAQQNKNNDFRLQMQELGAQIKQKAEKWQAKHEKLEISLRTQIEALNKKEDKDVLDIKKLIDDLQKKQLAASKSISDIEKFQQMRYEELLELTSTFNSVNEAVNNIIQQNNNRKRQLQKLKTQKSSVGDQVHSMSGVIDNLKDQIVENRRLTSSLKLMVQDLSKKQTNLISQTEQMNKRWNKALQSQREQLQSKILETNRTINQVSIQIMKNLQKVEEQAKEYTDTLNQSICQKLLFLDEMSKQMEALKIAFKQQMEETHQINRAVSQKMEKLNAIMTKLKSDLVLKVDGVISDQQRRSFQIKQISKTLEDFRKHISYQTQGLNIALSVALSKQCVQETLNANQTIKISSLLQGWVLELQEKSGKYRGQLIQRRKLLSMALNFLIYHGDKVKNALIDSGKDVYNKIIQENQEIFTSRKRGISKKGGSELPKLFF